MPGEKKFVVAVLVGSLRDGSYTRKVAQNLMDYDTPIDWRMIEIGRLPLYNEDLEANPPREWVEFRDEVRSADAVLFATPEYNRSIPGGLKNAIDVGSRPYGKSAFEGKPGAVLSVSPGAIGAFGANHHLRQAMVFLNMPTMEQPEAYVGNVVQLLDDDGGIANEKTDQFLHGFVDAFAHWIEVNTSTLATAGAR